MAEEDEEEDGTEVRDSKREDFVRTFLLSVFEWCSPSVDRGSADDEGRADSTHPFLTPLPEWSLPLAGDKVREG